MSATVNDGDKRGHLERARHLLAGSDAAALRYVALELRLCLELMTYEKLRTFSKYLPPSFLERTWQPPQLLKAMKQLDPGADKSVQLFVGSEVKYGVVPKDEEFKFVGEHNAFGHPWLSKHYNKLGSLFLHAGAKPALEPEARSYLGSVADEIGDAQRGAILGMWFGTPVNFECGVCKQQVPVSLYYAQTERRATCLNPTCEAEYAVELDGEAPSFLLRAAEFLCDCGESVIVQTRHLKENLLVACPACKHEYTFRCVWHYGRSASPPAQQAASG